MVDINEASEEQDDNEEGEESEDAVVDEDIMDTALEIGRNVGEKTGVGGVELANLILHYYDKLSSGSEDPE